MPSLSMQTISPASFVVESSSSDENNHSDDSSSCTSSSSSDFFCPCSLGVRRQANGQPTAATLDRVSEHCAAMRRQETKTYHSADYLKSRPTTTRNQNQKGGSPIDAACREKMVAWCYQVTDYCGFSRSTVEVALSLVDRFLSKHSNSSSSYLSQHSSLADKCFASRKTYQLAVMTALYTAVKVIEPAVFDPAIIASLGRGSVTEAQVVEMERRLLAGVDWNVNHPTAASMVYSLADLLPASTTSVEHYDRIKATLLTVALYQTELAVSDYNLVPVPSSTVAVAALLHAVKVLEGRGLVDSDAVMSFLGHVQVVTGLDLNQSLAVDEALDRLGALVDGTVIETALASLKSAHTHSSSTVDCSSKSVSTSSTTSLSISSATQQEDEVMADAEATVSDSSTIHTNEYKTSSETITCDYVLELNDMSTATSTSTSSSSSGRLSRRKRRGGTDSLDSLASADSAGTAWSLSPTCIIRGAARQAARYARHLPH